MLFFSRSQRFAVDLRPFPHVVPKRPELISNQAGWTAIGLEYHSLPDPGETSEFSVNQYALSISIGQEFQTKCWLDQQFYGSKDFLTGAVTILRPDTSYRFAWDRHINTLTLTLATDLLTHSAIDLLKTNCVSLSPEIAILDSLVHSIGLALQADLLSDQPGGRIYGDTLANALATHLLRHYSDQKHLTKDLKGKLSPRQVQLIIEFIDANLSSDLGLDELAALVELSPSYFCHAFKQTLGIPPHRYVIQQRVERAKQLIKHENFSLSEVAALCGFSDQSHLTRHFKRLTGMTRAISF